ncbi:hypothetical protein RFI_07702, partial [Reticulomyxa filosa]
NDGKANTAQALLSAHFSAKDTSSVSNETKVPMSEQKRITPTSFDPPSKNIYEKGHNDANNSNNSNNNERPTKFFFLKKRCGNVMKKNKFELEKQKKIEREKTKEASHSNTMEKMPRTKNEKLVVLEQWREKQKKLDRSKQKKLEDKLEVKQQRHSHPSKKPISLHHQRQQQEQKEEEEEEERENDSMTKIKRPSANLQTHKHKKNTEIATRKKIKTTLSTDVSELQTMSHFEHIDGPSIGGATQRAEDKDKDDGNDKNADQLAAKSDNDNEEKTINDLWASEPTNRKSNIDATVEEEEVEEHEEEEQEEEEETGTAPNQTDDLNGGIPVVKKRYNFALRIFSNIIHLDLYICVYVYVHTYSFFVCSFYNSISRRHHPNAPGRVPVQYPKYSHHYHTQLVPDQVRPHSQRSSMAKSHLNGKKKEQEVVGSVVEDRDEDASAAGKALGAANVGKANENTYFCSAKTVASASKQATVWTKSKRDRLVDKYKLRKHQEKSQILIDALENDKQQLREEMEKAQERLNDAKRMKQTSLEEFRKYQSLIQQFQENCEQQKLEFEAYKKNICIRTQKKEMKILEKKKSEVDKKWRALQNVPDRKQRDQICELKEQIKTLENQMTEKDEKWKSRIEQMKFKLTKLSAENKELQEQLKRLEQQRLQHWQQIPDNEHNTTPFHGHDRSYSQDLPSAKSWTNLIGAKQSKKSLLDCLYFFFFCLFIFFVVAFALCAVLLFVCYLELKKQRFDVFILFVVIAAFSRRKSIAITANVASDNDSNQIFNPYNLIPYNNKGGNDDGDNDDSQDNNNANDNDNDNDENDNNENLGNGSSNKLDNKSPSLSSKLTTNSKPAITGQHFAVEKEKNIGDETFKADNDTEATHPLLKHFFSDPKTRNGLPEMPQEFKYDFFTLQQS